MLNIFVDGDGCPVKQEVYRVAQRHGLKVTLVANSRIGAPERDWLELVVVGDRIDAADDWIVGHVGDHDIVVSGDIPLASRCLKKGAVVVSPTGRLFTEDNIGEALATREILSHLRDRGATTGGPAPFGPRDRSRFLHRLDEAVRTAKRPARSAGAAGVD